MVPEIRVRIAGGQPRSSRRWLGSAPRANLEPYLGSDRRLTVRVDPNWNDVMDQRISGDGVAFDRARLVYAVRSDRVPGLIEVVDDIGVRDC